MQLPKWYRSRLILKSVRELLKMGHHDEVQHAIQQVRFYVAARRQAEMRRMAGE